MRRFWKGEAGVDVLATRIAGSADLFGKDCRSVNLLAAHDGFTLADTLAYEHRHNDANGEDNRDGHGENFSWNNGAEGVTEDPEVLARRSAFARAMLGTLFVSTGTIMLTAGDEFGRSQLGNNNAYAQDNAITWIDWEGRDRDLESFVFGLAAWRNERSSAFVRFSENGQWRRLDGAPMHPGDWEWPQTRGFSWEGPDYCLLIDRTGPNAGPA